MHRIDHATKAADLNGTGKDGFTLGNAAAMVPATVVTPDIMNALQEEIVNAIEAGGGVLAKANNAQLAAAILQIARVSSRAAAVSASVKRAAPGGASAGASYGCGAHLATGVMVIAGSVGEIATSADFGKTWTRRTPAGGFNSFFNGACVWDHASADKYVLAGNNGEIETSADGITWTKRTQAGAYALPFMALHGSWGSATKLLVAVGWGAEIQTSSDGTTWVKRTPAGGYAGIFYGISRRVLSTDPLVAVGSLGEIQTSPDGTTWTKRAAGGGYVGSFFTVAEKLTSPTTSVMVATGSLAEIQTSHDGGVTWVSRPNPIKSTVGGFSLFVSYIKSLDLFIAWPAQTNYFMFSTDGVTWLLGRFSEIANATADAVSSGVTAYVPTQQVTYQSSSFLLDVPGVFVGAPLQIIQPLAV